MRKIAPIFSFDYMCAGEFEFDSVPTALDFLIKQAKKNKLVSGKHDNVFYICPCNYEGGVKVLISALLTNEYLIPLKRNCRLAENINSISPKTLGWLELDNGFFFFIDKEMFEATKNFLNLA